MQRASVIRPLIGRFARRRRRAPDLPAPNERWHRTGRAGGSGVARGSGQPPRSKARATKAAPRSGTRVAY